MKIRLDTGDFVGVLGLRITIPLAASNARTTGADAVAGSLDGENTPRYPFSSCPLVSMAQISIEDILAAAAGQLEHFALPLFQLIIQGLLTIEAKLCTYLGNPLEGDLALAREIVNALLD
ncbi:hypothetical protein AC578_7145 [Pseudocercospora eumusae]|uniref:Uncharacterized protein n=1 Tax=Pseudocercospora eumusae TaxID=321146 RepID=A0A139HX13_9PEZI|nr:hypothetical protein AC578_7145 [Pseudocercospora eumusae]